MAENRISRMDAVADTMGASVRTALETLGSLGVFFFRAMTSGFLYRQTMEQMYRLGMQSLPLVLFISMFVGFITPLSLVAVTGGMFLNYIGTAVLRAVLVEMGPTFTGLILAGRMGTRIASELGSMRVTEQIDAMYVLALDPYKYVVSPRILAALLAGPMMFVYSSFVSIVSAQLMATIAFGLSPQTYYSSMKLLFSNDIVLIGLYKSIVFAGLIGLSGCYFGFHTSGGAAGVGKASRATVTAASVLILIANFILTVLLT